MAANLNPIETPAADAELAAALERLRVHAAQNPRWHGRRKRRGPAGRPSRARENDRQLPAGDRE